MKPQPGNLAPKFTAPVAGEGYADDATLTLADLRGGTVVLVFYPKDDTPGCTKLYGKKYMGTERSSFVIGADGKIAAVLEKVSPDEHLKLLLEALG